MSRVRVLLVALAVVASACSSPAAPSVSNPTNPTTPVTPAPIPYSLGDILLVKNATQQWFDAGQYGNIPMHTSTHEPIQPLTAGEIKVDASLLADGKRVELWLFPQKDWDKNQVACFKLPFDCSAKIAGPVVVTRGQTVSLGVVVDLTILNLVYRALDDKTSGVLKPTVTAVLSVLQ